MAGGPAAPPGGQRHVPVLYQPVLDGLQPAPGGAFIDGTVGLGGHAAGLLAATAPTGRLLGLDRDPHALALARSNLAPFGDRAVLVQASYTAMAQAAEQLGTGFLPVDGILLDLGLSSLQLDDPARGFAFSSEGPLDMRFDPAADLSAADIVNTWPVDELAEILYRYSEEPHGRKLARAIAAARPLGTTQALAQVIEKAVGGRRGERLHPATRAFQALRLAVNGELEAVEAVLPQALSLLKPGGRLAVISFHSLEDRLVKRFFRLQARGEDDVNVPYPAPFEPAVVEITRKPIAASDEEIARNPRARSARLRIAEKL